MTKKVVAYNYYVCGDNSRVLEIVYEGQREKSYYHYPFYGASHFKKINALPHDARLKNIVNMEAQHDI